MFFQLALIVVISFAWFAQDLSAQDRGNVLAMRLLFEGTAPIDGIPRSAKPGDCFLEAQSRAMVEAGTNVDAERKKQ